MKDREGSHFEGSTLVPLFTFSLSETTIAHGWLFQYDNRVPRRDTLTRFTLTLCMPFQDGLPGLANSRKK